MAKSSVPLHTFVSWRRELTLSNYHRKLKLAGSKLILTRVFVSVGECSRINRVRYLLCSRHCILHSLALLIRLLNLSNSDVCAQCRRTEQRCVESVTLLICRIGKFIQRSTKLLTFEKYIKTCLFTNSVLLAHTHTHWPAPQQHHG